jgi:hypothetical protein
VGSCGTVLVLGLLVAGCTPDPGTTPSVTPTPAVSSPTPSPSPTPTQTENAQERQQRLDFEAAEKAYLTARQETERLAMSGGVRKATNVMKENLGGTYLSVQVDDLRTLVDNGWRTDRRTSVSVSANGGWSGSELALTACEDATKVRLLDEDDREVAKDRPRRFVQSLTATKVDGRWKITGLESKPVKSFDTESGCAA